MSDYGAGHGALVVTILSPLARCPIRSTARRILRRRTESMLLVCHQASSPAALGRRQQTLGPRRPSLDIACRNALPCRAEKSGSGDSRRSLAPTTPSPNGTLSLRRNTAHGERQRSRKPPMLVRVTLAHIRPSRGRYRCAIGPSGRLNESRPKASAKVDLSRCDAAPLIAFFAAKQMNYGTKRTDEILRNAVRIALTSGLTRSRSADRKLPNKALAPV